MIGKVVPFKKLINPKGLFFPPWIKERHMSRVPSQYTAANRYPFHDTFLRKNASQIKVFADVGASFLLGAPTTIDAKKALGPNSTVYATDIRHISGQEKAKLEKEGIATLTHSIVKSPLPYVCDAIRLANVSIHLQPKERREALKNCWKSLREHGYLIGATAIPIRPFREYNFAFVLRKEGANFVLVESTLQPATLLDDTLFRMLNDPL